MSQRPWFPFYPGDFYQDTAHLSLEEQGAYIRLLSHAWTHDGFIPGENKLRARILGVHHHRAGLLWGVIAPYWISYPGGYRNKRLDSEMEKLLEVSEKRAKAAESRWHANADANAYTPTPTVTDQEKKDPTDQKKVAKKKPRKPRPKFSPPTIQEVADYCTERGNSVSPEGWHAHYSSNGWRVGKNPMKDWKASVRYWETNSRHTGGSNGRYETPFERIKRLNGGSAAKGNAGGETYDSTAETVEPTVRDLWGK